MTKGNGDDHVAFMRFASSGGFHATGLSQAASLFDMDRTHQKLAETIRNVAARI